MFEHMSGPVNDSKEMDLIEGEEPTEKPTWAKRTFGKMNKGSLRGSIFTLLSTAIGSGCLALPLALKYMGLILGVFMLLFTAVIAYFGLINIALAADHYKTYHYPHLVAKTLGKKWGFAVDVLMVVYLWATLVTYQVLLGEFSPSFLRSMNIHGTEFELRILPMLAANFFIMLPLGLFRELTNLRFVSMFGAFSLGYVALLVIIEFPYFVGANNYSDMTYAKIDMNVFATFSICLYAYACHTNLPQIQGELARTSLQRTYKIARRGITGIFVPYFLLSLFGYLSCLNDTPELIILRDAPSGISNDWAMVISRVCISLTVVIAVPINLPPIRECIFTSIFGKDKFPSYWKM